MIKQTVNIRFAIAANLLNPKIYRLQHAALIPIAQSIRTDVQDFARLAQRDNSFLSFLAFHIIYYIINTENWSKIVNQKNVNESDGYSVQLYDLYSKGKEACSIFQVEIRHLADSINSEKDMLSWSDEERALEDTFKRLDRLSSDWYGAAMNILNQIPLVSLKARFSADVKTTDGELRALYPQYLQTGYMKVLLRLYDTMKTRTERLPDILKAYEEFCHDTENAPKKRGRKAVIIG